MGNRRPEVVRLGANGWCCQLDVMGSIGVYVEMTEVGGQRSEVRGQKSDSTIRISVLGHRASVVTFLKIFLFANRSPSVNKIEDNNNCCCK